MTGANYMGGKRSVARARTKDTTGKLQKRFFGTQRLNLLAGGLRGNKKRNSSPGTTSREDFISGIQLAHAKRGHGHTLHRTPPRLEPRNFPRITVENRETNSKIPHSKVLKALEISDPIFLRSAMDRIMALPDLVGLTASRTMHSTTRKRHGSPIRKPLNDGNRSKPTSTDSQHLSELGETAAGHRNNLSPTINYAWASRSPQPSLDVCARLDRGYNIVDDYDNARTPEHFPVIAELLCTPSGGQQFGTPLQGMHLDNLSPSALPSDFAFIDGEQQPSTPGRAGLLDSSSSSLGLFNPQTPEPLPLYVKFLPSDPASQEAHLGFGVPSTFSESQACLSSRIGSPVAKFDPFVHNVPLCKHELQGFNQCAVWEYDSSSSNSNVWNLFDESDPWHTVGRILGLEPSTSDTHEMSLEEELRTYSVHHRGGVGHVRFEVVPRGDADILSNNSATPCRIRNDKSCIEDLEEPPRAESLPDILTTPENALHTPYENLPLDDFLILSYPSSDCRSSTVKGEDIAPYVGGQAKSNCTGSPRRSMAVDVADKDVFDTHCLGLWIDGSASQRYFSEHDVLHCPEAASQCHGVSRDGSAQDDREPIRTSTSFDDNSLPDSLESKTCNSTGPQIPSTQDLLDETNLRCGISLEPVTLLSQTISTYPPVDYAECPIQNTEVTRNSVIELRQQYHFSDETKTEAFCGVPVEESAAVGTPTVHTVEATEEDRFLSLFSDSSSESDE